MRQVPRVGRSGDPGLRHEHVRADQTAIVPMNDALDQIVLVTFERFQPLGFSRSHFGNQRPVHTTVRGGNEDRVRGAFTKDTKVAVNGGPAAITGQDGSSGNEGENIVVKKGTIEKKSMNEAPASLFWTHSDDNVPRQAFLSCEASIPL